MIIGIDTSGGVCTVCALKDSRIICEFSINHKKTHSAMLVPMLESMCKASDISVKDASCIAVSKGPGSFTGLRIGAATAKGLSLSLGIPIVGVSSLKALSYNLWGYQGVVVPIMDARRNEVYTAAYRFKTQGTETIVSELVEEAALPLDDLFEKLYALNSPVCFLGDGVPVYQEHIQDCYTGEYSFAPAHQILQRAAGVALLGEELFKSGEGSDSQGLELTYLRLPQAERERLSK